MSESAFAVEAVVYRVDSSLLLNNVDLVGSSGELIALCGPNGASPGPAQLRRPSWRAPAPPRVP